MSVYESIMQGLKEAVEIEKKRNKEHLADARAIEEAKNDRVYTTEEAEEILGTSLK